MDVDRCRRLFAEARRAILATVRPEGGPHLVPIVHALLPDDTAVFAIDEKPKRTQRLQRLINLEHDHRVAVLADHYDDDWARLWWVRADGTASAGEARRDEAMRALAARYRAYRERPPLGPVVIIEIDRWRGWEAAPPPPRIIRPG
jgi:PPOX class probable F420-dependent enzyme